MLNRRGDIQPPTDERLEVKSFKDRQAAEAAYDSHDRGIRSVALEKIAGSVGRYNDFDSQFRLRRRASSERLRWIRDAMRKGRNLGPVKLYQIKNEFYVLDGNHRIAAAKELGQDEILAHIVELVPTDNSLQSILFRERAEFADRTKLPVEINVTEVSQYAHLLDQISEHRDFLQQAGEKTVSFEDAAQNWFKTIYRPLCNIIKKGRLGDSFPERTVADLYAYITLHQWKEGRKRHYGIGIGKFIQNDMEAFGKKMVELKDSEYPEMKHGITVFILMSVQAKKEIKLLEKIYELEPVREIHSVHGDVDMLVKVELTRDLLSSDAEVISQFVHEKIRQLPGVISTTTLIPGISKVKESEDLFKE
jgi:DNA-binding Lrp family transcriptional regulator